VSAPSIEPGAPLAPLAEYHANRGWQLVACQWHVDQRTRRKGTTPLGGMTGSRAPFLTGEQVVAKVRGLMLHPGGGPECEGRHAKPAVRTPLTVVGIDVDHGYRGATGGKRGGDTLVNAESQLGPLRPTYSSTARGPWQPSRRLWFRQPADLVLRDDFFREFGGDIEVIRSAHRYSWTWPAMHLKPDSADGRIVGPVLWYDADHNVIDLPHIDDLAELPPAWVRRGYELMAAKAQRDGPSGPPGTATPITARHADAIVNKLIRKFMGPPDLRGGDFRNVLFGLTKCITQRALARGHGEPEVHDEIRELFANHPWRGTPNDRDVLWIADGIRKGLTEPWRFELEIYLPDRTLSPEAISAIWATYPDDEGTRDFLLSAGGQINEPLQIETVPLPPGTGATDAELNSFWVNFTNYRDPVRLGRRTAWMRPDVHRPHRMLQHAQALVADALAGYYPAEKAVVALVDVYRRAGCFDPGVPRRVLAAALDAVLSAKVPA
jgi:hypothetical protein